MEREQLCSEQEAIELRGGRMGQSNWLFECSHGQRQA
jgi:hypothetical protein